MERKALLEGKAPPAFVLSMDANGLGVARTLGRHGITVVGADPRPRAPGLASKYVRPLVCPDLVKEPGAAVEALATEAEELGCRGVLFPTSDAATLFMSRQRGALSSHFDFALPSERVEEALVNKRQQYEEAVRLDIPVPDTYFPATMDDVQDMMGSVLFPAFIKPLYSHVWCQIFGNKGFIVTGPEELRERMVTVLDAGVEAMVQSIIWPPGRDLYSVGAYFGRDGYVSPPFCWHKKRQYPPNFGVGSLVESTHNPEVVELGMRFMRGLEYRGVGYVEFKRDLRDGRWKMVEMNARTGATNALQDEAGRPLVLVEYLDLIGIPPRELPDYQDGVLWWDSLNDLDSFWRLRARGELTLRDWVRSWFAAEVFAFYSQGDIGPWLRRYEYGFNLAKVVGGLLKMRTDEDLLPAAIAGGLPSWSRTTAKAEPLMTDLSSKEGGAV